MAPEVLRLDGTLQTLKIDMWSVFVIMAFAMDVDGYPEDYANAPASPNGP